MKLIDRFLNTITMYRLVLYSLGILTVLAFFLSGMSILAYSLPSLALSLATLVAVSYFADRVCAALWKRDRNPESSLITALILFLIIAPPIATTDVAWLVGAALIGIVSKYLFSYKQKHLFNPAAFSALALTLFGSGMATWWVATPALLPATLVLGLFIVRKLRRFDLWYSFVIVALVVKLGLFITAGTGFSLALLNWLVSWPTLFFSTIMLTEPLTMPANKPMRMVYGIGTALLFSIPFSFAGVYSTPQLALVLGNIFTFIVSPNGRTRLKLISGEALSDSVVEFTFTPNHPLKYTAGQYGEWTLPHENPDDRGVRRYFTFASAPEEKVVRLAIRTGEHLSTFKHALMSLTPGSTVSISNVAGDFTLPSDEREKLLFIAGGVGITPFISMIRSLTARGQVRDITLLYVANTVGDFAYETELEQALANGVRTVAVPTTPSPDWKGVSGALTSERIHMMIPDVADRLTYISGPDGMVQFYKGLLGKAGVSGSRIKTDYFPGL